MMMPYFTVLPLAELNVVGAWAAFMVFFGQLVKALLVLAGFWVAGTTVEKIIQRIAEKDKERRAIMRLLGKVAKVVLIVFGVVTALGTTGVEVLPLIAGLGLTGIGLALAFKDLLTSTVAGIVILLSRPFHEGDHLTVAGFEGKVLEIDLRYTRMQGEGKEHLVPNSTVLTSPLTVVRDSGVAPGVPEAVKEEARKQTSADDKE